MKKFAEFLNNLYYTNSNLAKERLMVEYFATTPDPARGYALAALTGEFSFPHLKTAAVKNAVLNRVDPELFYLSADFVGDLSETVALIWPGAKSENTAAPLSLDFVIEEIKAAKKDNIIEVISGFLDVFDATERWALLKLATGNLRVGVSARFARKALASFGGVAIEEVEEIWHNLQPPYTDLFAWLEKKAEKPANLDLPFFRPMMLSHPLDDEEIGIITPEQFQAEWKWDGIRVQVCGSDSFNAIYSRTGDDVSAAFPDIRDAINFNAVLDGELLVKKSGKISSFNDLQQRLNRKKPSSKMLEELPGHIMLYDILFIEGQDVREKPLLERRQILENWYNQHKPARFDLSPILNFSTAQELQNWREKARKYEIDIEGGESIEGMMFKKLDSNYIAGRPRGLWFKWKRDPHLIDAVMMYAQRGHGKRSSFYSDYTFGLWQDDKLLPIGKAYSGFTDEELKKLDNWIRNNTTNRFGPVREVSPALVLEIAFDSVNNSKRHKSGVALRFPRVHRIRWDKPASEADSLENLKGMMMR